MTKQTRRTLFFTSTIGIAMLTAGVWFFSPAGAGRVPRPRLRSTAAEPDPVLERGRYLVQNVTMCLDCHSSRDFSRYSGPLVPGTLGMGGAPFGEEFGLPGTFYPRNITPAGIGHWTDDELRRAVTAGVSRDGTALFPIMPWPMFQNLCEPDFQAIVRYVRSLSPVANKVPAPVWKIPQPDVRDQRAPVLAEACPDRSDTVAYGRYLVTIALCNDCHTPHEQGVPVPGRLLSGGVPLKLPSGGTARSANLTPEPETGLGNWSRETFIAKFRNYTAESTPPVVPGEVNTFMPWTLFGGMTDDDLGAIYDYLRTIPPVTNSFDRFTPDR